ncbi:glycosyltransferase family 2 protein [candidate division KSB1 bacterium]|nr:glycosyltransferase family 2 protein [candidate division KSB1 bacterium]RQW06943.1 MAG: glycosyltransferase family 2 protein [candidate division KSB1 bacterium]
MAFDLNNPLISIILPVFNRRHLVMRAIHSVEAQTIDDWELLIIDDGSWDAVEQDILPLVAERPNYRYMKHAQRRLSASRNIGMHAALGHFVTFLDSDDEYRPDHLELRLSFMKENPAVDIIHGGVEIIGPLETHYVQDAFQPEKKIHISRCCVGATFFGKKSAFIESGGFKELPYSAESELLPRLEAQFNVKKVDFPTYCYYTGLKDSICAQRREQATKK